MGSSRVATPPAGRSQLSYEVPAGLDSLRVDRIRLGVIVHYHVAQQSYPGNLHFYLVSGL
jgi:hypothetical protein